MGSANITLEEILRRKVKYSVEGFELFDREDFDDDDPYSLSYDEFRAQCDGELQAYTEMLEAVRSGISEDDFIDMFVEELDTSERISRMAPADENIIDIGTGRPRSELERLRYGARFAALKEILGLFFPITTDEDFE